MSSFITIHTPESSHQLILSCLFFRNISPLCSSFNLPKILQHFLNSLQCNILHLFLLLWNSRWCYTLNIKLKNQMQRHGSTSIQYAEAWIHFYPIHVSIAVEIWFCLVPLFQILYWIKFFIMLLGMLAKNFATWVEVNWKMLKQSMEWFFVLLDVQQSFLSLVLWYPRW